MSDSLPEWRRPAGVITYYEPTQRRGLRDALYELIGDEPQSVEELSAAVRDQWGEATDAEIGQALGVLRRIGAVLRLYDRYLRSGGGR